MVNLFLLKRLTTVCTTFQTGYFHFPPSPPTQFSHLSRAYLINFHGLRKLMCVHKYNDIYKTHAIHTTFLPSLVLLDVRAGRGMKNKRSKEEKVKGLQQKPVRWSLFPKQRTTMRNTCLLPNFSLSILFFRQDYFNHHLLWTGESKLRVDWKSARNLKCKKCRRIAGNGIYLSLKHYTQLSFNWFEA